MHDTHAHLTKDEPTPEHTWFIVLLAIYIIGFITLIIKLNMNLNLSSALLIV